MQHKQEGETRTKPVIKLMGFLEVHMLRIIKQVFCIHVWEYESDMFNQKECRKCGKIKNL
ncbi:hypothetical protein C7G75_07295 [Acinetobacter nosocomialis]|nr:hypothetical protein C7G75_07295 [Acinetobacter nosocomialis]